LAKIRAWLTKGSWALWVALSGVVVVLAFVLRRAFEQRAPEEPVFQLPAVPPKLQQKVEAAQEQALVARVQATAQAEGQKQQLAQVMAIDDGAERRRRLADLLTTLK
jgi:anti-sigma-K factor RskA